MQLDESELLDAMYSRKPFLMLFPYTQFHIEALQVLSREISETLDLCASDNVISGESFMLAYGKFWFWVLGAYEVARYLRQHKSMLSSEASAKIDTAHSLVKELRILMAKQEYPGDRGSVIGNELSVKSFDRTQKDFLFITRSGNLWARKLIADWNQCIFSIKKQDFVIEN